MACTRFPVANVTVDIVGQSRLYDVIVHTLTAAAGAAATSITSMQVPPADITLRIGSALPETTIERSEHTRRFPYRFDTAATNKGLRYSMSTFRGRRLYSVDLDGLPHHGSPWTATATIPDIGRLRWLPPRLVRAATREHANIVDYFTAVATNEVLEPLLWTKLLDLNHTLMHAAAGITPDGRGVAFTGVGQVGKTSIALGLVGNHDWRYLADDRVIIGPAGLQRLPRPLRLAGHHVPILDGAEAVGGMSANARHARARRRIPIVDAIGADRLATSSSFDAVVNVFATPENTALRLRRVSRAELVDNIAAAIINDFWEFLHFMNAAAALVPAAAANRWHDRVTEVVEDSLPAAVIGLDLPSGSEPDRVSKFIAESV